MALEGLYWTHVEYFPMHFNCVSSDRVDALISVFSHGQTGISIVRVWFSMLTPCRSHDLIDVNFSVRRGCVH
jgi:hypothetical protein